MCNVQPMSRTIPHLTPPHPALLPTDTYVKVLRGVLTHCSNRHEPAKVEAWAAVDNVARQRDNL